MKAVKFYYEDPEAKVVEEVIGDIKLFKIPRLMVELEGGRCFLHSAFRNQESLLIPENSPFL